MNAEAEPWYQNGLQFECTRCGHCCTGAPGVVWVTLEESQAIAARLNLQLDAFGRRYLRLVDDRLALVERTNGDCVFWDRAAGCTIYEARPGQCRTWPFWPDHLATPEDWQRTQRFCPGASGGRLHTVAEIEASARLAAKALR